MQNITKICIHASKDIDIFESITLKCDSAKLVTTTNITNLYVLAFKKLSNNIMSYYRR